MRATGRPLSKTDTSVPDAVAMTNGAHSIPGWAGSLSRVNGRGDRDSLRRVPPPGAENALRPSSASRPDIAWESTTMRSATASGGRSVS